MEDHQKTLPKIWYCTAQENHAHIWFRLNRNGSDTRIPNPYLILTQENPTCTWYCDARKSFLCMTQENPTKVWSWHKNLLPIPKLGTGNLYPHLILSDTRKPYSYLILIDIRKLLAAETTHPPKKNNNNKQTTKTNTHPHLTLFLHCTSSGCPLKSKNHNQSCIIYMNGKLDVKMKIRHYFRRRK